MRDVRASPRGRLPDVERGSVVGVAGWRDVYDSDEMCEVFGEEHQGELTCPFHEASRNASRAQPGQRPSEAVEPEDLGSPLCRQSVLEAQCLCRRTRGLLCDRETRAGIGLRPDPSRARARFALRGRLEHTNQFAHLDLPEHTLKLSGGSCEASCVSHPRTG